MATTIQSRDVENVVVECIVGWRFSSTQVQGSGGGTNPTPERLLPRGWAGGYAWRNRPAAILSATMPRPISMRPSRVEVRFHEPIPRYRKRID